MKFLIFLHSKKTWTLNQKVTHTTEVKLSRTELVNCVRRQKKKTAITRKRHNLERQQIRNQSNDSH